MTIGDRQADGLIKTLWGFLGCAAILASLAILGSESVLEFMVDLYSRLSENTMVGEPEFEVVRFGLGLMYRGLILSTTLIWWTLRSKEEPLTAGENETPLVSLSVAGLLILWLPTVLLGQTAIIGGERYWWLVDDMMITMRYAHNLASGAGLVWNPGEHVEGYTNFLWALYMALVHLLPVPLSKTALVISLTNIMLSGAVVLLILKAVRLLKGGPFAATAAVAVFVLSSDFRTWSVAGTETTLLAALVLLATILILRDAERPRPSPIPFFVIGVMTLVRSDAVVLAALLCGTAFILQRNKARVALFVGLFLLFPLAHHLFRWIYYGDLVPNTAHLKVFNWDGRFIHGVQYLFDFLRSYTLPMVLVALATLRGRSREEHLLGGSILLYSAYVAYAGGDVFPQNRFFVPILPLLFILSFVVMERLISRQTPRLFLSAVTLATIPVLMPGDHFLFKPQDTSIGNVKIALLLKENLPPGAKAADLWAGIPFYFSDVVGVDLLGKNDPYIARLPAVHSKHPGHNKFDFDYSLGVLEPDVVIGAFSLPADVEDMRRLADAIPWRGRLYFNETFQDHCLPNPINIETWRTIFVCDWSQELSRRKEWRIPD